jgi:hypothetical protein
MGPVGFNCSSKRDHFPIGLFLALSSFVSKKRAAQHGDISRIRIQSLLDEDCGLKGIQAHIVES